MKRVKRIRILIVIIVIAFLAQASYVTYSMLGNSLFNTQTSGTDTGPAGISTQETGTGNSKDSDNGGQVSNQAVSANEQLKDEVSLEISQDILNLIKSSDPDNYTKNVNNYKALLKDLNVHIIFKEEIERLITKGNKLPDILTAYAFLNDCYGNILDLEKLTSEKKSGKKWPDIFKAYNTANPEFVPRNFDAQYLEKLMQTPGIDQEDIMIADRISQNTKTEIDALINKRVEGLSWRLINAQYGIVNGQEKSPHLSVTREQLAKYTGQTGLPEKKVIEAMVMANKLDKTLDAVLREVKQGLSKEEIYSGAYEEKY